MPSDYREFLRDYPGFLVPAAFFPLAENVDGMDECDLYSFYGSAGEETLAEFYLERCADYEEPDAQEDFDWRPGLRLLRDTQGQRPMEEGWPKELLPIGCTSQLSEICLALYGLRPGAIFLWRANPSKGEENFYLIAHSFDEFMRSIFRPEGYKEI